MLHLEVRPISAAQTLPLRLEVLRPGRPRESAVFAGDDEPETRHFGAFVDGTLLSIASLFAVAMPEKPDPRAYQLRGMATAENARNQGLARALLETCVNFVREQRADILWCNARIGAAEFYRKFGFETLGPQFDIPDVGPHFRMWMRVMRDA